MQTKQTPSTPTMTCADHHVAAAEHHAKAEEFHRNAAALYEYGNYAEAGRHARQAEDFGQQAMESCGLAMK
jgi:hypothetical protein